MHIEMPLPKYPRMPRRCCCGLIAQREDIDYNTVFVCAHVDKSIRFYPYAGLELLYGPLPVQSLCDLIVGYATPVTCNYFVQAAEVYNPACECGVVTGTSISTTLDCNIGRRVNVCQTGKCGYRVWQHGPWNRINVSHLSDDISYTYDNCRCPKRRRIEN
jgi:hypothetical protein